jgi:hypothetical protein
MEANSNLESGGGRRHRDLMCDHDKAAFNHLISRSDIDKSSIFAYGHSLGCGAAIHLTRSVNQHSRDQVPSLRAHTRSPQRVA